MLTLPHTVRIYIAAEPVDLRKGFDGLSAATREIESRAGTAVVLKVGKRRFARVRFV